MAKVAEPKTTSKSGTTIKKCLCEHAFQDKKYGSQNRVCNLNMKGESECTVCGKIITQK